LTWDINFDIIHTQMEMFIIKIEKHNRAGFIKTSYDAGELFKNFLFFKRKFFLCLIGEFS